MTDYAIHDVPAAGGRLGLSRLPGRYGGLQEDLARIVEWGPRMVLTLTTSDEIEAQMAWALRL